MRPAATLAAPHSTIVSPTSISVTVFAESSGGAPLFSFSGSRPTNLGVKDGKLAACPSSPNCVNSQAPASDAEHYIAPLSYSGTSAEAIARLKGIITAMPRTQIITESENYLYAEFTSALMGFVDDVEFYVDEAAGVVQVRSASRLGQSDLGVNRKRVEEIRAKL
ncbi:DUF1499 domain-containing protein [Thermoleptolyngbya sp. C42_A2020_037]|uniref:DUF1499 domain-containing protein n=1 Tax=Thermoleptolyngbya sp. C42_A2020_037 TaxID=2747799 RepID=UPI0019E58EA3|nr:DUF1499 domain-containing protein [Thermoleptolyngbya sp. C42_A2020_037]